MLYSLKILCPVLIIKEYVLPLIATDNYMIKGTGKLYARRSRHDRIIAGLNA